MSPRQATFEGFAPPAPVQGLFVALLPNAAARASIAQLAEALWRERGLRERRIDPPRYHITLHYLGESAGPRVEVEALAIAAARPVRAEAFDVTLSSVTSFRGGSDTPCVLRNAEPAPALQALWQELGQALARGGQGVRALRSWRKPLTPCR